MSYDITKAKNPENIEEQEYGISATKIKFGNFTSCLGIVAIKSDRELIGIHLVIVGKHNEQFAVNDVHKVTNLIGSNPREVVFAGHVRLWEDNLKAAYAELKKELKPSSTLDEGDGVYQAVIDNGKIKVSKA